VKKILIYLILCLSINSTNGQTHQGMDCWNFGYGKTGTPGDFLSVGLELAQSAKSAYLLQGGYEFSRYRGLKYSALSLAGSYRYYVYGSTEQLSKKKINVIVGIGGVGQIEWEPNIYKDLTLSQRCNYGITAQLMGEYFFDKTLGFFVGAEQKYLLKKEMGQTNYNIFFGVKIHFGGENND
jgi:hypothetical protein